MKKRTFPWKVHIFRQNSNQMELGIFIAETGMEAKKMAAKENGIELNENFVAVLMQNEPLILENSDNKFKKIKINRDELISLYTKEIFKIIEKRDLETSFSPTTIINIVVDIIEKNPDILQ